MDEAVITGTVSGRRAQVELFIHGLGGQGKQVIDVLAMDAAPLIGMSLLDGYEVHIQAVEGGSVSIERI